MNVIYLFSQLFYLKQLLFHKKITLFISKVLTCIILNKLNNKKNLIDYQMQNVY